MAESIGIRLATVLDSAVLGEHRAAMFRDMGTGHPSSDAALHRAAREYFRRAIPSGEYVGWVACPAGDPALVVAGAGVQLRSLLPRPDPHGHLLLAGQEGLILNVYVTPTWRRRGVARRLMLEILAWAPTAGVGRLVLHASTDGRPLYQALGFRDTNEMRYAGELSLPPLP